MLRAQIHDELLLLVREELLPQVASIVKTAMESVADVVDEDRGSWWKLRVPLTVKLQVGLSWGELETYESSS